MKLKLNIFIWPLRVTFLRSKDSNMKKKNEVIWPMNKIQKKMDKDVQDEFLKNQNCIANQKMDLKKLSPEQSEYVRECVAGLPSGELAVVYLKFWEGLCEYEISKGLNLSIIVVEKLLSSALNRLKCEFINLETQECA